MHIVVTYNFDHEEKVQEIDYLLHSLFTTQLYLSSETDFLAIRYMNGVSFRDVYRRIVTANRFNNQLKT